MSDQTLPAILERRYGVPPRRTLGVTAALVVAVFAVWFVAIRHHYGGKTVVLHKASPAFNFLYAGTAIQRRPARPGELLRLGAHNGPLKTTTTVTRFSLPPYTGDPAGALPVYAENRLRAYARRYRAFAITADNRARVHTAPGYEIGFTFTLPSGRIGEGTDLYILPLDAKHPTRGVVVSYRLTKRPGRQPASRRRVAKQMRSAFRSFEWGSGRF